MTDAEEVDPAQFADEGPERRGASRASPIRTCVVTRTRRPIAELIRFVASPDGLVVPDLKHTLPGRGIWVGADRETLAAAVKRRLFARGLKADVKADAGLIDLTERLLETDALQALALANKAGAVTIGFSKVEAAVESGGVCAIYHASDAAADGIRKLRQAITRTAEVTSAVAVLSPFTSAQLSLCLGREHVIHLALAGSSAGGHALSKSQLLLRFRDRTVEAGEMVRDRTLGLAAAEPGLSFVKTSES